MVAMTRKLGDMANFGKHGTSPALSLSPEFAPIQRALRASGGGCEAARKE